MPHASKAMEENGKKGRPTITLLPGSQGYRVVSLFLLVLVVFVLLVQVPKRPWRPTSSSVPLISAGAGDGLNWSSFHPVSAN